MILYLSTDKTNKASFESIQRSIIVLCLDQSNSLGNDARTFSGHQMLHGGGPTLSSGNRWFDKTIQVYKFIKFQFNLNLNLNISRNKIDLDK